jgi:hypothetical protein
MPSTTIYEFNYYMNSTKVYYQISPYCHSANPAAHGRLTHNFILTSMPPHTSVSVDRGQSPLSVCTEDFVSYDTSSSKNLHWCAEVLIVFCQTF